MRRRRMLPSRDLPARADTGPQCRPDPRPRSLAAFAACSSNRCQASAQLNASLDAAPPRVEGDLRDHRYYAPPG